MYSNRKIFLYGVLMIILCSFFQFYKFILQTFPGIITGELMNELHLTGAGLGNLAGSFYYSLIVTQFFVGLLVDRFGTRRIAALAIGCASAGILFFSVAKTALTACLARALMGAGVSFSTVVYLKMAAGWFSARHYTIAAGLLATASMTGAIFGETPLALFIQKMGWRQCLFDISLGGMALALLFYIIARDAPARTAVQPAPVTAKEMHGVLQSRQNWLLVLYAGLAFSPLAVFGGLWGNPFLQTAGHYTKIQSSTLISLIFMGLAVGGPLMAALSVWFDNRRNLMCYGMLSACIMLATVVYLPHLPVLVSGLALFLFGLFMGSYMLAFSLCREMNSSRLTGTVIAMVNSGDAILTGLTEPAIGKWLDWMQHGTAAATTGTHFSLASYQIALSLLPCYLFAASLVLLWVRMPVSVPPSQRTTAGSQHAKENLSLPGAGG